MGNVLRMNRDRGGASDKTELQAVKLQIILNMSLDRDLKPAAFKAAVYLLVGPGSGPRGECFLSDRDLAECIGVSPDTIAKTILKSSAFQRYFEFDRGRNRGDATDYRVTDEAIADAAERKGLGLSWLCRADRTEVETTRKKRQNEKAGKNQGFAKKGRRNSGLRNEEAQEKPGKKPTESPEETRVKARKKHPPIPEEEPRENPACAAVAADEFDFDEFRMRFLRAYPKVGDEGATENELRKAIKAGADPDRILAGARAYADEQDGNAPRYIAYSENWLAKKRWEHSSQTAPAERNPEAIAEVRAKAIREKAPWIGRHLSAAAARELVARQMVTAEQCRAAGVDL